MSSDLVAFLPVECKRMEFAGLFVAERHLGIYHGRNEGLWDHCQSHCGAPFPHHAGCWRDAGAATVLPNPGQGTGRTAQPMGPKCRSMLDFQTARSHMSQLVRVCRDAACTNIGICCSCPPNLPFLYGHPWETDLRAGDAGGSLVKLFVNTSMPHVHLPSGSRVLCSWGAWKAQSSQLLAVNVVLAHPLFQPCPSLFPSQKIPSTDVHTCFTARIPEYLSKSLDAYSFHQLSLTSKNRQPQFGMP